MDAPATSRRLMFRTERDGVPHIKSGLRDSVRRLAATGRWIPIRAPDCHLFSFPRGAIPIPVGVKWATGIVPSPPSDTIKTRLRDTNFLVEDVEWGSAGHSYFQVIREDAHPFDQLFDPRPGAVGPRQPTRRPRYRDPEGQQRLARNGPRGRSESAPAPAPRSPPVGLPQCPPRFVSPLQRRTRHWTCPGSTGPGACAAYPTTPQSRRWTWPPAPAGPTGLRPAPARQIPADGRQQSRQGRDPRSNTAATSAIGISSSPLQTHSLGSRRRKASQPLREGYSNATAALAIVRAMLRQRTKRRRPKSPLRSP